MKINISKNLKELSATFKKNGFSLYLVGGYVRNAVLGFCETDIDLCGNATPDEILGFIPKNLYNVELVNKKLGTLHITSKINDEIFEYTTFRSENYPTGGEHSPNKVEFVRDIVLDAKRRDFTANAIYYDIENEAFVDFYDGLKDIKSKRLRTVETPEFVFESDGLRMLRLVRIACELNFKIEKHSFMVAKDMIKNLSFISHERFGKEIGSTLFADYKYSFVDCKDAYLKGISYLTKLNAWPYVFSKLYKTYSKEQDAIAKDFSNLLKTSDMSTRVVCFVVDFLSALKIEPTKQSIDLVLGENGLNYNKKEVLRYTRIILAYLDVLGGFANNDQKRLFIQHNIDIIDDVVLVVEQSKGESELKMLKDLMFVEKVPMTLKDLAIDGNVLKVRFPQLEKHKYSTILKHLLTVCCVAPELNNKKSLLDIVSKNI